MEVYNVPHASAGPSHNDAEELASSEGQRPAKRSEKVLQVPKGGGLLINKHVFWFCWLAGIFKYIWLESTWLIFKTMDNPSVKRAFLCTYPVDDDGDDSATDSKGVSKQELAEAKKEESAKAGRKKAGLPELELDALPSSLASKMSNLSVRTMFPFCIYIYIYI